MYLLKLTLMAQNINTHSFLHLWLSIIAIINVVYTILLWSAYALSNKVYDSLFINASSFTIICVVINVSLIYIWRNLRFGIYLSAAILIMALFASLFLLSINVVSVCVSIVLMLITFLLVFLRNNGDSIWSQMNDGIDFAHFRHIYQLAVFVIVLVSCFWIYRFSTREVHVSDDNVLAVLDDQLCDGMDKENILEHLNKTTITLGQISKIENLINDIPPEYEARIMALRHILAGHIVSNIHDFESFKMAYLLRKDALSQEQQEILDWFFKQQDDVREIWKMSDGVSNIATFQKNIRGIMKKRNISEF